MGSSASNFFPFLSGSVSMANSGNALDGPGFPVRAPELTHVAHGPPPPLLWHPQQGANYLDKDTIERPRRLFSRLLLVTGRSPSLARVNLFKRHPR